MDSESRITARTRSRGGGDSLLSVLLQEPPPALRVLLITPCVSLLQGAVLRGRSWSKHHLQQDPRAGPPSEGPLPESARRHHRHRRGSPAGHQRVSVPVPLRPLELLGPGREDRLWTRAESRSVCLKLGFLGFGKICLSGLKAG